MANQYDPLYPASCLATETAEDGLTFVDFYPDCEYRGGCIAMPKYSNFRTLIDRANEWLRTHPQWDIKTCETLEFQRKDYNINPERMIYLDRGNKLHQYVRALRLWIIRSRKGRVKQIGYINIIPELKEPGCIFPPIYESLDEVIERFNCISRNEQLPGPIITVETVSIKKGFKDLNPDRSNWRESMSNRTNFLFIIRVFFEIGETHYQEIGITDFVPEITSTSSCLMHRSNVEPFADMLDRVSEWCFRQTNLTICNIQSLTCKINDSFCCSAEANSQTMFYYKGHENRTHLAQVLRVAYIKFSSFYCNEPKDPISSISCITFAPVQLTFPSLIGCLMTSRNMPEFESLQETKHRVSAWLRLTGAQVLNMETAVMKLHRRKGVEFSSVETYNYDTEEGNELYVYILRAYVIGSYRESLEETLPHAPCNQTQSGCVLI